MARHRFINMEILGTKELENAFKQLPAAASKQVLRDVLKKAATPVAAAAAREAPRDEGRGPHLRDSIAVSTRLSRRQQRYYKAKPGAVTVYVGPRVRHAHLVEFGTGPRYHRNGKYVGMVAPNAFMRRAWRSQRRRALEIVKDEIWKSLRKKAKSLHRQAARLRSKGGVR